MRRLALSVLSLLLASMTAAAAPTDIVAVDEFIEAPRTLFGRTRAHVEQRLGAPAAVRERTLPSWRGGAGDAGDELAYPGVVIGVSRASTRLRRVEITEPRWTLPYGLNVGVARDQVERRLGEPQLVSDASVLYLYSDGYPNTVEFYFRAGRVHRIEWLYSAVD